MKQRGSVNGRVKGSEGQKERKGGEMMCGGGGRGQSKGWWIMKNRGGKEG